MRKIIFSLVKSIADFIEFDEAVSLSTQKLSPEKLAMCEAQRDAFYQRMKRAENAERPGSLNFRVEFDRANAEVRARRVERKRLAKHRDREMQEARALKEMMHAA